MKALVVEGDLMSQCVLAKLLAERGHEVVCHENAEQAILAYQKEFYPLVFVDGDLSGMDGLQFCKWLKSQPEGERTFIMVAVGPNQPGVLTEVLAVGASDYLMKPFEVGSLKVRLTVAERQIIGFFRGQELESQIKRREQEVDGLQAELRRAGESLMKEAEARRQAEEGLDTTREELAQVRATADQRLQAQADELCAKASELQNATTFRHRVEEDARKVRDELEALRGRYTGEVETLRKAVAEEKARCRELTETHQRTCNETQARVRELTIASREADVRRQQAEAEGERAAAMMTRAQAEWGTRERELTEQLKKAREEAEIAAKAQQASVVEALTSERNQLAAKVEEMRAEYTCRFEQHVAQLRQLDEQVQSAARDRQAAQTELMAAREELATKARDYVAAVLKAGEAVEEVSRRRQAAQDEFTQVRERLEAELTARRGEIGELQVKVTKETAERAQLGKELEAARAELQERPKQQSDELARVRRELEAREGQLAEVRVAQARANERCVQLEGQIQQVRKQAQESLRRFAAALQDTEEAAFPAG